MFDVSDLLSGYDLSRIRIGAFGGLGALDITSGARLSGFPSVIVASRGRDKTYMKHFRARQRGPASIGCVDDVITVDEFEDVLNANVQQQLRSMNTIFLQSRYFWVYTRDYGRVEREFNVPMFGSRTLLRIEDRDQPYNQHDLLSEAGIRTPRRFALPDQIDRLVIVKVHEALRGHERAFFLAWDKESYESYAQHLLDRRQITKEGLEKAVIEEYIIGVPVTFHFFCSPLRGEVELLGMGMRRQTNLDGFLRMTAKQQEIALRHVPLKMIEVGQVPCTLKESLLEKTFDIAEEFVSITQSLPREIDPSGKGIIGPFALQGVVVAEEGREDIVIFDVSFRSAGMPGAVASPYSTYLYGRPMSVGERIGIELRDAIAGGCLEEVVT